MTASAAGAQASTVSGITTENFNGFTAGTYTSLSTAIGTVTSAGEAIVVADAYGGAGGTGKYFAIGAQSGGLSATLSLPTNESYFGIWWSAGDSNNTLLFYSGTQLIGSANYSTTLGTLDSTYYGNPNGSGQNPSEPYAYLNFIGTGGTTFNKVVLQNTNASTGFESDNWSVRAAALSSPYPGTIINGGVINAVPEASSFTLAGLLGSCVVGRCLWRKRNRPA